MITFTVHGTPAPQGSKRHVGRGIMVESSAKVKPWREAVKHAALEAMGDEWETITGPCELDINFWITRPKHHYRTGRFADQLRDNAPIFVARTPDLSKLIRSTEDALTDAGLWRDDSLVAAVAAVKRWTQDGPCAVITVRGVQ